MTPPDHIPMKDNSMSETSQNPRDLRAVYVRGLEHGTNPIPAATRRGPLVVTSNVFGHDRKTGLVPGTVEEEYDTVFANLVEVMKTAGSSAEAIMRVALTMASEEHRPALNAAWVKYFPDPAFRPCRDVTFGATPAGCNVYLNVIAYDEI
jgi:enamine deaminase RidA (YjgF/YER057c/UK114 family)